MKCDLRDLGRAGLLLLLATGCYGAHAASGEFHSIEFREPFPASTTTGAPSQPTNTIELAAAVEGQALPFDIPASPSIRTGLNGITLEWAMKQKPAGSGNPDGTFLEGAGFKINADFQYGSHGAIFARFHEARDGVWVGMRNSAIYLLGPPDGQWHYYTVTYDLRVVTSYLDGELQSQIWLDNNADRIGPMFDASNQPLGNQVTVGKGQTADARDWDGTPMKSVRVSSIALTAAQVRQNFENHRVYRKTIYASPTGTPGTPGTETQPTSLTAALAEGGLATKIVLLPGMYPGNAFQISRSGVTPLEHCLITGVDGAAPAIIESDSGQAPTISGLGHLVIRNLTFRHLGSSELRVDTATGPVLIDACRFGGPRKGVMVSGSSAVTIQNCVFNVGQVALHYVDSRNSITRNNTIAGGTVGVQYDGNSDSSTLLNNLVSGQSSVCVAFNSQTHKFFRGDGNAYGPLPNVPAVRLLNLGYTVSQLPDYLRKWYDLDVADTPDPRSRRRGYSAESRSFALTPTFADPSAGDFRLAPAAANAIDAGVDLVFQRNVGPPLYDATGALRPKGNAVDVGAYETEGPFQQTFVFTNEVASSAGVFETNGTLIKTLWSGRRLPAGVATVYWNGLNDLNAPVPPGDYQVKLIAHNVKHVWEGVVGNSSTFSSGPTVHAHFQPIHALAISGNEAFYVPGYNEGKYEIHRIQLNNPGLITKSFGPITDIFSDPFIGIATDGSWLYTINSKQLSVYSVAENKRIAFTGGQSAIDVGLAGSQGGRTIGDLKGVAVQKNGNILFVSHRSDFQVYKFDKRSGASLGSIVVTEPRDLAVTPAGDLWVVCKVNGQQAVVRYTNLGSGGTVAASITGCDNPLAVAVSPVDGTVLVADGGNQQQVKAYDQNGTSLWTHGQPGGYGNGPSVTPDKFGFNFREGRLIPETFLAVQEDGSFWVGDTETSRSLRFTRERQYKDQMMYIPHTYVATSDPNNPTRVFNQWREFRIDYSKPLGQGWTLVTNWGHNLPESAYGTTQEGLAYVATLSNGRTYGLIPDGAAGSRRRMVELTPAGLRLTPITQIENAFALEPDGSLTRTEPGQNSTAIFYRMPLLGFTASHDPQYGEKIAVATAPFRVSAQTWMRTDPIGRQFHVNSNGLVISFAESRDHNGWHLGAVRTGGNQWLWRASPTAGGLNGLGNFDSWVEYGGSLHMVAGRHIVYGFNGEFYRDEGQANQFMHFYDNGLFVGQFGQPLLFGVSFNPPGGAGNAFAPSLVQVGDKLYMYHNDESSRGSHRWRVDGLDKLRELIAPISLDQTPRVIVTPPNPKAAEAGLPGAFEIRRSGTLTNEIVVNLVVGGTASNGVDYLPIANSVVFPVGVSVSNIVVTPINDLLKEGPETIVLSIATGEGYSISIPNSATVVMNDDEMPTIDVVATNSEAAEDGSAMGRFLLTRTGTLLEAVTVTFTLNGGAINGTDYQSVANSIRFGPSQLTATVDISAIDDTLVEGTEIVTLTLNPEADYNLGLATGGSISILDDDAPVVTLTSSDIQAQESGSGTAQITISRSDPSSEALIVNLEFSGTAVPGSDYQAPPASVTIAEGFRSVTLTIRPIDDDVFEQAETIIATLAEGPGYKVGAAKEATLTIQDDDPPVSPPSGLLADVLSSSQVLLSWEYSGPPVTGFRIERSRDGTIFFPVGLVDGEADEFLAARLNPETRYFFRVTAVNNSSQSDFSETVEATTRAVPTNPLYVRVNFQPASTQVPQTHEADDGLIFGDRGNGFVYGWQKDNVPNAVDRHAPTPLQIRRYTFQRMQAGGNNVWEIEVPRGIYFVYVVSGDPIDFSSYYSMEIEGALVLDSGVSSEAPWVSWEGNIAVVDGRLTLENGPLAQGNKVCFVEIYRTDLEPFVVHDQGQILPGGEFSFSISTTPGRNYRIEGSTNLTDWIPITTITATANLFDFVDQDATTFPRRFYRAAEEPE